MDPSQLPSLVTAADTISKLGVPAILALWAMASTYAAYRLGQRLIESLETRNKEARENGGMAQQCAAALQQASETLRIMASRGPS